MGLSSSSRRYVDQVSFSSEAGMACLEHHKGYIQGGARLGVTYCFLPGERGRACLHELQRAIGWALARGIGLEPMGARPVLTARKELGGRLALMGCQRTAICRDGEMGEV